MRLYHFTNRQYGLENIERRRLKIARISQLNDPFEFLGVASRSANIRRRYQELKDGWDKFMGVLYLSGGWRNPGFAHDGLYDLQDARPSPRPKASFFANDIPGEKTDANQIVVEALTANWLA